MKKFLLLLLLGLVLLFPEKIFSSLAGIFIIAVLLFLIIELLLDVYIIVVFLYHEYKEKKNKEQK